MLDRDYLRVKIYGINLNDLHEKQLDYRCHSTDPN